MLAHILADTYTRFAERRCIHLLLTLKVKEAGSSVMLVSVYRRHTLEDRNIIAYRHLYYIILYYI